MFQRKGASQKALARKKTSENLDQFPLDPSALRESANTFRKTRTNELTHENGIAGIERDAHPVAYKITAELIGEQPSRIRVPDHTLATDHFTNSLLDRQSADADLTISDHRESKRVRDEVLRHISSVWTIPLSLMTDLGDTTLVALPRKGASQKALAQETN